MAEISSNTRLVRTGNDQFAADQKFPLRDWGMSRLIFRLLFVVQNFFCSLITLRNNHALKSSATAIGLLPVGKCFLLFTAVRL